MMFLFSLTIQLLVVFVASLQDRKIIAIYKSNMFLAISKAMFWWGCGGDKSPRLKRDSCYQDKDYLAHTQWLQKN